MIFASIQALRQSDEEQKGSSAQVFRAARITAALLSFLPAPPQQQRRGASESAASSSLVDQLAPVLTAAYARLGADVSSMATKVALLDCATALLKRVLREADGAHQVARIVLKMNQQASPSTASGEALVNLSLLSDLAVVQSAIVERVRKALETIHGEEQSDTVRAHSALEEAHRSARGTADTSNLQGRGRGWKTLEAHLRSQQSGAAEKALDVAKATANGKGKRRADDANSYEVPASLLATVETILPHLAADPAKLRTSLARTMFRGKSEEEVVEMLLDGAGLDQAEDEDEDERGQRAASPPTPPAPIITPANRRANIFDNQPLDATRLRYAGGFEGDDAVKAKSTGKLSPSLRAAILARVQAQDAEQDAAKEEWNPFAEEEKRLVGVRQAGFEEELDADEDEDNAARSGQGRGYSARGERSYDGSSSADEGSDAALPQGPSAERGGAATVAAERAGERILILAYSSNGPSLFARNDAAVRRSLARKALLADLERSTGRKWDDSLVESWGTMFERNPRKDALLMAAGGGGGAMLQPNTNRRLAEGDEEGQGGRSFGPDRGRGGRLTRGGGRGGGGVHKAGAGHSGNDRSARRKEQRGNEQRTRGADRKARAMGGAGAGV